MLRIEQRQDVYFVYYFENVIDRSYGVTQGPSVGRTNPSVIYGYARHERTIRRTEFHVSALRLNYAAGGRERRSIG